MSPPSCAWRKRAALLIALLAVALPLSVGAQFDPARAYKQSDAVRKRYPDPPVRFETPGFAAGKADFTSHEEMMTFLYALQRKAPGNVQLRVIGESEEGRDIPLLVLTNAGVFSAPEVLRLNRPVVFLQGLQHGNEPAGGEVMLALAQELATGALKPLLDRITVVIVPRCNPDGAHYFTRTPARGIDINRDHIKLDLPDTIALHKVINEFQPEVFVDAHEFSVATRWIQKFGKLLAYDLTFLYATNPNVAPELTALAEKRFRTAILRDVEKAGYSQHWYFTTSYNMEDKKVAMGGTSPDIGRNTAGLQNAISFLIETRGVGIGRDSYARRVHTHMVAIGAVLQTTAANAEELRAAVRAARLATVKRGAAPTSQDTIVVRVKVPVMPHKLAMLNPQTGEPSEVEVQWEDSLGAIPDLVRQRPAAYLMPPAYGGVARRLALSGIEVRRLRSPVTLDVESFQVADKRVSEFNYEGHMRSAVTTEVVRKPVTFPPGSYVFTMAQAGANLIAVALEPESPSSFVTFGIIPVDKKGATAAGGASSEIPVYRLLVPAALDTTPWEPRP
jgi:hypothetical protein